jgi:hypothetical protein
MLSDTDILTRKAKAWDSLMSVIDAYAEPEMKGVKSGGEALDGFIAVYQRMKGEMSALRTALAALAEEWEQQADKQEAAAPDHENINAILAQANTLRHDAARIRELLEDRQ